MTAPRPRHLRAVDSPGEPTIEELKDQVRELSYRLAMATSLMNQRDWTGCETQARLVRMALNGATIDRLKEEDQKQ